MIEPPSFGIIDPPFLEFALLAIIQYFKVNYLLY